MTQSQKAAFLVIDDAVANDGSECCKNTMLSEPNHVEEKHRSLETNRFESAKPRIG